LARYDAMCQAIETAYKVDEVKEIRDQAIALETYARQAHNVEAERQACEIRLRAERNAGKLSAELERSSGGGREKLSPRWGEFPKPTLCTRLAFRRSRPRIGKRRYPSARSKEATEPEYVLLDEMTDSDILFNVARLRKEGTAKLRHAEALEAFGRDKTAAAA
jgi:hypothetical protein